MFHQGIIQFSSVQFDYSVQFVQFNYIRVYQWIIQISSVRFIYSFQFNAV